MAERVLNLTIKPIYGWGWFKEGTVFDVPSQFDLAVSVTKPDDVQLFKAAIGKVDCVGHPLHEMWVFLSPRHTPDDGDSNVSIFYNQPFDSFIGRPDITGFAQITRKQ
ncbi:MAG TPA: hypothetical protein VIJ85_11825 [Rhizomicrobium sp.]